MGGILEIMLHNAGEVVCEAYDILTQIGDGVLHLFGRVLHEDVRQGDIVEQEIVQMRYDQRSQDD